MNTLDGPLSSGDPIQRRNKPLIWDQSLGTTRWYPDSRNLRTINNSPVGLLHYPGNRLMNTSQIWEITHLPLLYLYVMLKKRQCSGEPANWTLFIDINVFPRSFTSKHGSFTLEFFPFFDSERCYFYENEITLLNVWLSLLRFFKNRKPF